jgi:hypothetical protein
MSLKLVFEVSYGGRFDRSSGCDYMGGNVCVHDESYDPDNLSFFELEDICKDYGYKAGDLMYFKEPDKTLMGGLHLITCDDDVLFMVGCHKEQVIVHLYAVCFEEGQGDVEEYDEDEARVEYNDPWWKDKVSDVEDLFDVEVDTVDTRTRTSGAGTSGVGNGDNENEGDEEDGNHVEEHNGNHSGYVRIETGPKNKKRFEDVDDDDTNSEMGRSDILESPLNGDEEDGVTSEKKKLQNFTKLTWLTQVLKLKMTFSDIQTFKEAVKEYNV